MKTAVRYYTRSGNTRKLAQAIGAAIDVQPLPLDAPLTDAVDVLFLGCSYYAFDVDPAVKAFIAANRDKIGQIVCFGTSAMMKSIRKPMLKVTAPLGIPLSKEEFHCRGAFGPMHKGQPDENALRDAAAFARKIISA